MNDKRILQNLGPSYQAIYDRMLAGESQASIARSLGVTKQAVGGKVRRMIDTGVISVAIRYQSPGPRWSSQDDKRLASMFDKGSSIEEIAEVLGRSKASVRGRVVKVRRQGVVKTRRRFPKAWSAQEEQSIIQMRKKGESIESIAKELGRTCQSVSFRKNSLVKQGLVETRKKKAEDRAMQVLALRGDGLTSDAIASRVGITKHGILMILGKLRKAGVRVPPLKRGAKT